MDSLLTRFPNAVSSSQSVVVCYRGPGCSTYSRVFEPNIPTAPDLVAARSQAGNDYLNKCQQYFVDDLTETPFGDLGLDTGEGTSGIAHICTGFMDGQDVECDEDSVWLIQMEGPEGSLRVKVDVYEIILVRGYCIDSVQVLSGDCTWFGNNIECAGTEATIMVIPTARYCCGNLNNPLQTQCANVGDTFDEEICLNEGPPIGFESDPTCDVYDQFNANLPREAFDTDQLRHQSCDSYQTGNPPVTATTDPPTQSPTQTPTTTSSEAPTPIPSLRTPAPTSTPTELVDPTMAPTSTAGASTQAPSVTVAFPTTTPVSTTESPTRDTPPTTSQPSVPVDPTMVTSISTTPTTSPSSVPAADEDSILTPRPSSSAGGNQRRVLASSSALFLLGVVVSYSFL